LRPRSAQPFRQLEYGARPVNGLLYYLSILAPVAVLIVLLLGLWNMTRGKSPNLSQKLMRWRVGLQFLAIVIIVVAVYLIRN